MPSTFDTITDRGLFGLFKGSSGSGKSVGALSFPGAYVFDIDLKMPNIAQKHFPNKEIHWDTFPDIFKLWDKIQEFKISCPYETLILDSVTTTVNLCLRSTAEVKGENIINMLKTIKKTGSGGKMIELMSIDYYNAETRFIQELLIPDLKQLWIQPGNPKHVIVIAHVITSESAPDLKTKVITRTRSIVTAGRKVAAYIPTAFDDMWMFGYQYPDIGSGDSRPRHVVSTEAIGEDDAKTAYKLNQIIDFTDGSLYEKIQNVFLPRARLLGT